MSFGKDFSPKNNGLMMRSAMQKQNVLLVHAAGNDAKDVDTADNFPTRFLLMVREGRIM